MITIPFLMTGLIFLGTYSYPVIRYASFDEDKRGSLEVGKFADMVILSENPYEVEKTDLKNIKVEQLLLQGLPYRSCRENIFKAALRGLHSRDA